MRSGKSKSILKKIGKKVAFWSMKKPELVVIDSCAILWAVNWPASGWYPITLLITMNLFSLNCNLITLQ